MLSLLAHYDPNGVVRGLKEWPKDQRPPVLVAFLSFRAMVGFAFVFLALAFFAWWKRHAIMSFPWFLRIMILAICAAIASSAVSISAS